MAIRLSQERLRLAGDAAGEMTEAEQAAALPAVAQVTARQQAVTGADGIASEAGGGDDDEDAECDAAFPGEEAVGLTPEDEFYADAWESR
jgi:hypothetical protein